MPPDRLDFPLRVSTVMRRQVRDGNGEILGRIADVETTRSADGRERVTAVIVTAGRWGRLLGYESAEHTGPWLLERLAQTILRRHTTRVPWRDVSL
jgi:sporulation protein YlmC with PRC-barrel domain